MNPAFTMYRRSNYQMEDESPPPSIPSTSAANEIHEAPPPVVQSPSVEQLMAMMMTLMQGMQQAQQNNTAVPKASFKLTIPETYNGIRSPKIIDTWLFSIREYCELANIPTEQAVPFAASLLRENAKAWWRTVRMEDNIPKTFEQFETELKAAFRPSDAVRSARNQLAVLQQRGSVQSYTVRFRDLMLEIPDLSEAEALDRFVRGLREKTRLEVEHRGPNTLNEAINIAERYDSIIFSQGSFSQTWRPPYNAAHRTGPTPMEVDAFNTRPLPNRSDDLEKDELRRKGACFNCKKVGHIARYCPERTRKSNDRTGNGTVQ
jgi:Ty3 transposon capsid-like protein/Zinc knuckle